MLAFMPRQQATESGAETAECVIAIQISFPVTFVCDDGFDARWIGPDYTTACNTTGSEASVRAQSGPVEH